MKTATRIFLTVLILILATSALQASGLVGIYAVVSKVVFEPNDKAPERIQIWGAFTLVDGGTGSGGKTLTPQRGYMYFALPAEAEGANGRNTALKEWADFKAIAGTNQAVAFARIFYFGAFTDDLISRLPRSGNPIRLGSAKPASPTIYPLNMGLTKLSNTGDLATIVNQLHQALKR
jgi:hypothetical protein